MKLSGSLQDHCVDTGFEDKEGEETALWHTNTFILVSSQ